MKSFNTYTIDPTRDGEPQRRFCWDGGRYAYALEGDTLRVLKIVDVSNPITVNTPPWRIVHKDGRYVYVLEDDTLRIIDVIDPTMPVVTATVPRHVCACEQGK